LPKKEEAAIVVAAPIRESGHIKQPA